jgi:hypothetical protein
MVLALGGCISPALHAQMLVFPRQRPQPELTWDAQGLAVGSKNGTLLQILHPGEHPETIAPPKDCLGLTLWNGHCTAVRMNGGRFYASERLAPGKWFDHPILINQMESGFPERLYESDYPGWYLGVNVDTGFVKDGHASCWAWYRQMDDGHLEMDEPVQLEWDHHPVFQPQKRGETFALAVVSPALKGLVPFLDYPIHVPGAFILVSWQTGILWLLKDREETPSQVVNLSDIGSDLIAGSHPFPPVLLGIQPMKDGRVLIAQREPGAIHAPQPPVPPQQPATEVTGEDHAAAAPEHPGIIWKLWDPKEGEPAKADGLPILDQAPTSLPTADAQWHFTFGFNRRGDLVLPWRDLPIPDSTRKSSSPPPSMGARPQQMAGTPAKHPARPHPITPPATASH